MNFSSLPTEDKRDIINRVTADLNIRSATIVEKDWWVTQILRAIFSLPYFEAVSFKGGTSLSKCWKLIDRFSEDIDIAIDREFLGFGGKLSKTQISDKLRRAACSFVREKLQFDIKEQLLSQGIEESQFDVDVNITPVSTTDPEVVNIAYQPVVKVLGLNGIDEYIKPRIKVEVSGRSMSEPVEPVAIRSFIDEIYPTAPFAEKDFDVRVVLPTRTFLEKVFLLHEEFAKPDGGRVDRMSRHMYDVSEIVQTPIAERALTDEDLYKSVINHRRTFVGLKGFDYNTLYPNSINIIPPMELMERWKDDYHKMQDMIYRTSPSFDTLIEQLSILNQRIKELPYRPG